jgi:hypothetical protein
MGGDGWGEDAMAAMREITESEASGATARIYNEIRVAYAAPYVSSLFRHLAIYPGLLEWSWEVTRPAFESGALQHTGWNQVDVSALPALAPISREALRELGVSVAGEAVIRDVCRTFTRVSPVNLVFAGCLARLLRGQAGEMGSAPSPAPRDLPPALPQLPGMVPWDALDPTRRAVVDVFETTLAGDAFVPGLYRILARWPGYLAYVARVLGPSLSDQQTLATCEAIADRVVEAAPEILATLPAPATPAPIGVDETERVLSAIAAYRGTSPQMVGFGTLLLNALPA